jgi:hypothetical protein
MENYIGHVGPECRDKGELADAIRRARLVMVVAREVRLTSIECRHRAAVLCDKAESLRKASISAVGDDVSTTPKRGFHALI